MARQESLNGLHTIEFLDHLLRAAGERPYEVHKYIVIRRVRDDDPRRANVHRRQCLELARQGIEARA